MTCVNEIMYGDFFRVNRDGLCIKKGTIVQIKGVDGDNKLEEKGLVGCAQCHPLDKYQYDGGIWLDYLDPISLTAEILEKSGFILSDGWWCNERFPKGIGYVSIAFDPDGEDRRTNCVYDLNITKRERGHVDLHLDYIHELQHALRLCGIEKEIVLP